MIVLPRIGILLCFVNTCVGYTLSNRILGSSAHVVQSTHDAWKGFLKFLWNRPHPQLGNHVLKIRGAFHRLLDAKRAQFYRWLADVSAISAERLATIRPTFGTTFFQHLHQTVALKIFFHIQPSQLLKTWWSCEMKTCKFANISKRFLFLNVFFNW